MASLAHAAPPVHLDKTPLACACGDCGPCRERVRVHLTTFPGPERSVRAIQRRCREVRRAWKQADREGHASPLASRDATTTDADRAAWAACNTDHHAAELTPVDALGEPAASFDDLLDAAERLGWEGADLVVPTCLDPSEAVAYAGAWRRGRVGRLADETTLAEEARFAYYDELHRLEEQGYDRGLREGGGR